MWFLVPNTVDVPFTDECMECESIEEAWAMASFLNVTGKQFGMAMRVAHAEQIEQEQALFCERSMQDEL
jgi:hypothetical protein